MKDFSDLAAAAIRRDASIRHIQVFWHRPSLPEHIDGDAAARIPISANPKPAGLEQIGNILPNAERAILMEAAMIAKTGQE